MDTNNYSGLTLAEILDELENKSYWEAKVILRQCDLDMVKSVSSHSSHTDNANAAAEAILAENKPKKYFTAFHPATVFITIAVLLTALFLPSPISFLWERNENDTANVSNAPMPTETIEDEFGFPPPAIEDEFWVPHPTAIEAHSELPDYNEAVDPQADYFIDPLEAVNYDIMYL